MDKHTDHSLGVYRRGELIFSHDGKWLHPLFELELFLSDTDIEAGELYVRDKIVGKAAAMLMIRLGLRRVHAKTLSEPGLAAFGRFGVDISYDLLVPRIQCQTETILENIDDPEEASVILLRRGKRDVDAVLIAESLHVKRGRRTVLENLSFAVTRGEKVIIQGDNGAGKSTLLGALLGVIPRESGTVVIGGTSGRFFPPEALGYLGQHSKEGDLPITPRELLRLGASRWKGRTDEAGARTAESIRLTGISAYLDRPLHSLSGGERRRADLARCFVQEPRLLLLDEPTAGLDRSSRETVISILTAYAQLHRSAIVMVTHDVEALDMQGWRYHELREHRLVPLSRPVKAANSGGTNGNP